MDNNNNINNSEPQGIPVQPVQPAQPVQPVNNQPLQQPVYQPGLQQQYQQPYQQQYQQPYQQQVQPQYMAQPYQAAPLSDIDMMSQEQKSSRRKIANILCFISLGLHFLPSVLTGTLSSILEKIGELSSSSSAVEPVTAIMSTLIGGSYIASWVLVIIARIKFKESKFAKILIWVYIGILAAAIICVILVIAMCAYMLKDCQGF